MPVEFIGMIFHRPGSDLRAFGAPSDFVIDRGYVRRFARAHEDSGFDRALLGTASVAPEGAQVAAYAAAHTDRLSFLVSHRPGFRAPTVAARELATLDHFSGGRAAVLIISVRAAAAAAGRAVPPRISISFRPILGATEELAWQRAERILEATTAGAAQVSQRWSAGGQRSVGSQRLLAAADKADRHDRALWTPIAKALGAAGNTTALVGTAETVALALLD